MSNKSDAHLKQAASRAYGQMWVVGPKTYGATNKQTSVMQVTIHEMDFGDEVSAQKYVDSVMKKVPSKQGVCNARKLKQMNSASD